MHPRHRIGRVVLSGGLVGVVAFALVPMRAPAHVAAPAAPSPADGHTIHVTAPHVVAGRTMGPYHHYCKVLSPEPVIECLVYERADSNARLSQVEYIVAKSITRTDAVSLEDWNRNWHDHAAEIATGRVQVHDLPPEEAKKVSDLVATTDGIIYHLVHDGERVPNGRPIIAQAVGHKPITRAEKFAHQAAGR